MQSFTNTPAIWSTAAVLVIAGAATLAGRVMPSMPAGPIAAAAAGVAQPHGFTTTAAAAVARTAAAAKTTAAAAIAAVNAVTPAAPPAVHMTAPAAAFAQLTEQELRSKLKWIPVRWDGEKTKTLDEQSRVMLAQVAAQRAGLDKVGLSYQDVYGVINAETSWIPRSGLGRNGVKSHGLAQFEPRTARGLGLKDPNDPVQAVVAAAVNMKHGAEWAEDRIDDLHLTPEQYQQKLREGVSIYYNLSIKGRNKWDGLNTAQLPVETQRHIQNVRAGAEKAQEIAQDMLG
jgi:hypothetical protein